MLSFIEHQDQIDISQPPTQLPQSRKYLRKRIKIRNKLIVQNGFIMKMKPEPLGQPSYCSSATVAEVFERHKTREVARKMWRGFGNVLSGFGNEIICNCGEKRWSTFRLSQISKTALIFSTSTALLIPSFFLDLSTSIRFVWIVGLKKSTQNPLGCVV